LALGIEAQSLGILINYQKSIEQECQITDKHRLVDIPIVLAPHSDVHHYFVIQCADFFSFNSLQLFT